MPSVQGASLHDRVDSRDRWEVVHEELRELILSGELAPGLRLREEELAGRFGVSRGPVREAIRVLENSGLAVRVLRQGSYVAPLDPVDFEEVFTLRMALEELAIRRSIARNRAELLFRLEQSMAQMRRALELGRPQGILEPDLEFHAAFFRTAEHARLLKTWEGLKDPIRRLIMQSGVLGGSSPSFLAFESVREHEDICAAVRRGDVEAAVQAVHRNLAVEPMLAKYSEGGAVDVEPPLP